MKEDAEELVLADCEVDVSTTVPIPALCSSDEESEDSTAVLYLPIAPEVRDIAIHLNLKLNKLNHRPLNVILYL